MNYGFIIDNRKCIGCHACSVACKSENEVPLGVYRTWVKYTETGVYPDVRRHFQVTRCNHCANPPCVRICPVTAMYQRADGIVEFDLAATSKTAAYPRLRWVVSERDRLPLRADFQLADGRVARVLEWKEWRDRSKLMPKAMSIKDTLRGSATQIEVVEFEARPVSEGLFSLTDASARRSLPE